jgi:raffinose/stachyose/melibiose transport system permease protein
MMGPADEGHLGRLRLPVATGFVGPAFVLYGAMVLLPCLGSFAWAFTRWDGIGPRAWVGGLNFEWLLLENDGFWTALANNLFLMVVPACFVVPLALLFAALIHRGVWGASMFRVVFLFPNILGGIAATLLWLNAYDPHSGLVNATLVKLGGLLAALRAPAAWAAWCRSFDGYAWLAPAHLYQALIPIYLWMACGFNLILYLAAMEGIDPQLYEAAALDGAPAWRQFFFITLPMIREVLAVSAVFLIIGGLNAFELIWLLTSQDPATGTHVLGTLMVSAMFKEFAIGRAAAIAVVMFVLVFLGSATVLRILRREAAE